jgi:hypothetical protein
LSIPVLLTEMSRVQAEIVKRIVEEAGDIECLECTDAAQLDEAITDTRAQVVVAGTRPDGGAVYDALLYRHPRLRVVAIAPDARAAIVHELRPHQSLIADLSAGELVATIRAAAGQGKSAQGGEVV